MWLFLGYERPIYRWEDRQVGSYTALVCIWPMRKYEGGKARQGILEMDSFVVWKMQVEIWWTGERLQMMQWKYHARQPLLLEKVEEGCLSENRRTMLSMLSLRSGRKRWWCFVVEKTVRGVIYGGKNPRDAVKRCKNATLPEKKMGKVYLEYRWILVHMDERW